MQWIPTEWLLLASPFLVALLLIKLFASNKAIKSEYKAAERDSSSTKLRVEPSATLPESTKHNKVHQGIHYQSIPFILTQSEQNLYRTLQKGLSNKFLILMKVRVADVLQPERGMDKSAWQSAFNRIKAKHFDFVLCSQNNYEIIAAIELDDSSHQRADRKKRDNFLNAACESANFPLIRFQAKQSYEVQEITSALLSALRTYRLNQAA